MLLPLIRTASSIGAFAHYDDLVKEIGDGQFTDRRYGGKRSYIDRLRYSGHFSIKLRKDVNKLDNFNVLPSILYRTPKWQLAGASPSGWAIFVILSKKKGVKSNIARLIFYCYYLSYV